MDDRVIKLAIDSFENDDLLHAKELVQGQVRQARNDFIKAKLNLKNDIDQKYVALTPDNYNTVMKEPETVVVEKEPDAIEEPEEDEPKPRKRLLTRKKK